MPVPHPLVSVICPTYHEPDNVEQLLECLRKQTYPASAIEIIIVDNSERDDDLRRLSQAGVIVAHEPTPGSYAARNHGLSLAEGDIIAFTDSDCRPEPEWLEKAVEALQDGADRVAGGISLYGTGPKVTVAEDLQKSFAFDVPHDLETRNQVAAANFVIWRDRFEQVGPFNHQMLSGGDVEWGRRAKEAGLVTRYVPEAKVRHPARSSVGALFRHRRRIAGATAAHRKISERVEWAGRGLVRRRGVLQKIFGRDDIRLVRKLRVLALATILHAYQTVLTLGLIVFPRQRVYRS